MGGTRPPIEIEHPPIEILALVCGRKKLLFFFGGRSPVFGRKSHLNFRFRSEKAFGFRRIPFLFFFGDHLIFTEKSHQSKSVTMKIWVKFVYGTNSQKILATCLFFTKVQSTLKKRPTIQNFTI